MQGSGQFFCSLCYLSAHDSKSSGYCSVQFAQLSPVSLALQHAERDNYLRLFVFISEVAWKKDYISGKLLAFGFVATMRLLSNYFDLLLLVFYSHQNT